MCLGRGVAAYLHILCCDNLAGLGVQGGVDVDPEVELQQAPKALQDATIQVLVVLLLEQLLQAHNEKTSQDGSVLLCIDEGLALIQTHAWSLLHSPSECDPCIGSCKVGSTRCQLSHGRSL